MYILRMLREQKNTRKEQYQVLNSRRPAAKSNNNRFIIIMKSSLFFTICGVTQQNGSNAIDLQYQHIG